MKRQSSFHRFVAVLFVGLVAAFVAGVAFGQSTSGVINGKVKDSSGAIISGATVVLENPVSGYSQTTLSATDGSFQLTNIPFHAYRMTVISAGFNQSVQTVQITSTVPLAVPVTMTIGGTNTVVNVDAAADLDDNDPNFHTDIDRSMLTRLPIESPSSGLSSIVTELSPGVAADSNGLLHGLGDHNSVSFSIDGQPITDQQSKVFSNQLPADAVQSLSVIEGAPPAEFGDKTSLVVVATTRSGQGIVHPTGSVSYSYGNFGTSNVGFDLSYGGKNWGNFFLVNGMQSGRFLDAPEFKVFHDKGNSENVFDRVDFQLSPRDTIHTNLQYTRSWFQTPNSYDTQYGFLANGQTTGIMDQRSKIETFDIAPTYTHTLNESSVFNFGPYIRRDTYRYVPSNDPLNDLGPIQQESVAQQRSLTNAGVHADISYVKGHNNIKVGGMYQQTFLRENDQLGIVDPSLNDPTGDTYSAELAPYDLTRGGSLYSWRGRTDVKQLALYAQDQITAGNWLINFGLRGDFYNGLSVQRQAEPRAGVSYSIKKTGTVLRVSYARTQETPFNENLVLSATGCSDPVLNAIFSQIGSCVQSSFDPGFRNEFHAGFQQSVGRHFVISGDYIWKYTHNGYDFSVLGATPITFPIEWHNSKIPGFALSGTLTEVKGLSARVTMSSVAARFFNPQVGGVGATPGSPTGFPFRIDHDERFNETTHIQYKMPFRKSLYYSFNWKFDSGLVAGSVPCYNTTDPNSSCGETSIDVNGLRYIDLSGLTADEQFQAGLACDGVKATETHGFTQCLASSLTSNLVSIPAPGTENDDRNPPRIRSRNLFDMEMGDDKIFHWSHEKYAVGARITAINVTNKYSLYNFLSTFSGTHYVTPRAVTAEVAFHF